MPFKIRCEDEQKGNLFVSMPTYGFSEIFNWVLLKT